MGFNKRGCKVCSPLKGLNNGIAQICSSTTLSASLFRVGRFSSLLRFARIIALILKKDHSYSSILSCGDIL